MLKDTLLECGIDAASIEVIPDEPEATDRALQIAAPGDLLLILGDNVKRSWKQIIYFKSGKKGGADVRKKSISLDLPDAEGYRFDGDVEIISDERGVRIAREEGD